jgi:hypothetical protein
MNLRRQKPKDSLDLLLDTMCNAFGGIILLAVLVALLARQEAVGDGNSPDSAEMLSRRISQAELTLQQTRALLAELIRQSTNPAIKHRVELVQQRSSLQATLAELQAEVEREKSAQNEIAASDPAERLKELKNQLAQALATRIAASNSLETVRKENERLRSRLAEIRRQTVSAQQEVTQRLRLPKERNIEKDVFNIIVQYGRVYPLRNANLERNTVSIDWEETLTIAIPTPKPDKGLDPQRDRAALAQFFRSLPREEYYLAFYVFEDSFPSFNLAKQMAVAAGFDYGWMPLKLSEAPLKFAPSGRRPKAQ